MALQHQRRSPRRSVAAARTLVQEPIPCETHQNTVSPWSEKEVPRDSYCFRNNFSPVELEDHGSEPGNQSDSLGEHGICPDLQTWYAEGIPAEAWPAAVDVSSADVSLCRVCRCHALAPPVVGESERAARIAARALSQTHRLW